MTANDQNYDEGDFDLSLMDENLGESNQPNHFSANNNFNVFEKNDFFNSKIIDLVN